jgi:hypothetical protein
MKALAHLLVLVAFGVQFGNLPHETLHLLLHREQIAEHRHALGEHGASRKRQTVLRQVTGGDPLGEGDFAVIERLEARQHLEQGGLTRAVRTHQAHTIARRDEPIEVFKQQLGAETLSGRRKLDHIGLGASPAAALVPGLGAGFGVPDDQRCRGRNITSEAEHHLPV